MQSGVKWFHHPRAPTVMTFDPLISLAGESAEMFFLSIPHPSPINLSRSLSLTRFSRLGEVPCGLTGGASPGVGDFVNFEWRPGKLGIGLRRNGRGERVGDQNGGGGEDAT